MPNLRGSEWLILILIIVLLFGAKRLPDAARGLGRSLRIFKAETKGLKEDEANETATTTVQQVPPPAIPPAAPPVAPTPPTAAAPAEPVAPPATAAVPPAEPGSAPER